MAKAKEQLPAVVDAEHYPALVGGVALVQTIRENMGGEEISPADLNVVKMPTGGSTTWEIPTAGESVATKTITGIIVHITRRRAFWKPGPLGSPPDCRSSDMLNGFGDPGGDCLDCPNAKFSSAKNDDGTDGPGQACTEKKLIFILREGQHLPDVIGASPGSLDIMRKWQLSLGAKPYASIISELSLVKDTSAAGFPFARIKPRLVSDLPAEAAEQIRAYAQELQSLFGAVTIDREEAPTEEL